MSECPELHVGMVLSGPCWEPLLVNRDSDQVKRFIARYAESRLLPPNETVILRFPPNLMVFDQTLGTHFRRGLLPKPFVTDLVESGVVTKVVDK